MKLVKRILVSVLRRKTSTIILLLTTFMLGNVLAVSMSITQSASAVEDNLLSMIGGKMIIETKVSDNVLSIKKSCNAVLYVL